MSASVNSTYPGSPAAAAPWAMAHTLPAQVPAGPGAGLPGITRSGRLDSSPDLAATSPVPSELQSSTRTTLSAPG